MKNLTLPVAITACLLPIFAFAGQGSVNGFATIGSASSNESNLRYGADGTMTKGADIVGESKVGIQADYIINQAWSVTAQAVLKPMMDDRERLGVTGEWLFASYRIDDSVAVRFGKLRLPLFMYSEQLEVGKAYAMARLPQEMYGMTPINAYNGVDVVAKFDVGDDGELTVQPYAGMSRFDGRNTADTNMAAAFSSMGISAGQQVYNTFEADIIKGLNVQYVGADGHLKLRAGYLAANLKDVDGMTVNMANSFGANGYSANNVDASFASLGAQYRTGNTTVTAEYGQRRIDSASFAQTDGYYVTLDHKVDQFIPYVSYAAIDSEKNKTIRGATAFIQQQNTWAVGLGYAVTPSSVIKGEVSQINVGKANTSNYFASQNDGTAISDKSFNVYRLNYNLLF